MANLHKFVVTDKLAKTIVAGSMDDDSSSHIEIAGNLYVSGDVIYLPEHQANHYFKSPYLINGLLEYAGEVEVDDTSMTEEFMTLYDAKLSPKKNILPVLPIKLATGLVKAVDPFALPGADSAGGFTASRRMYVSKIGVKYLSGTAVTGAAVRTPWHLVTAGVPELVSPTVLTAYDYNVGTYSAVTNGNIDHDTPITWAVSDMLIIGYTSKFSSVMFDRTTANNATTTITVFYWTASGWKEFLDENDLAITTDYTSEVSSTTLSAASAGDKTRIVWWTQPTDWITGGPETSQASSTDYCVGIKFSGGLGTLENASFYPVMDKPLTDVKLGSYYYGTEHYYKLQAGTWTNSILDLAGWGIFGTNPTDALYISTDNKWSSLFIDMSAAVNDVATGLTYAYWNGVAWIAMTCSNGTENPAGTPFAQDGWITITSPIHPSDWKKCAGTDINANMTGVGEWYWFRIMASSGLGIKAATAVSSVESNVLAPGVWKYFEVKDDGFVESGAPIQMICMLEDADVDKVEIMAIASDV